MYIERPFGFSEVRFGISRFFQQFVARKILTAEAGSLVSNLIAARIVGT